jgi:hypothetical protein
MHCSIITARLVINGQTKGGVFSLFQSNETRCGATFAPSVTKEGQLFMYYYKLFMYYYLFFLNSNVYIV